MHTLQHHPFRQAMTTINKHPPLSCDKVLDIQELLESILLYLDFDDPAYSRLLATVCRRWYSYFEPYIWKKVVAKTWDTQLATDLQCHGSVIRDLSCHRVDKSVLKSISYFGTSLQTLHLTLDQHSVFVPYDRLEETFLRIQSRLTTVSIRFDASLLNVSMLWALSQLPHLAHLHLQVHGTVDTAALHVQIIDCCPALKSLTWEPWTPSSPRPLLQKLKTNVQRTMAPKPTRLPTTVQEAIGRDKLVSSRLASTSSMAQPVQHSSSTLGLGTTTNIHRIDLCGLSKDLTVFITLIKSCPRLEVLHLRNELTALVPLAWSDLSSHCPNLRTLRLTGQRSSLLIGNSLLFPRLESLYIHTHTVQWSDWTATNIDRCLAEHQQKFGTRHPLKTLSLTGDNTTSLPVLLNILSARSLGTETLVVGSRGRFQQYFQNSAHHGSEASRFLTNLTTESLRNPWNASKNSLTRLDLHTSIMATKEITVTFFRRLQDLTHLQALCVSTKHIYDWVPVTFRIPHYVWKGKLPIAEKFSRSGCNNLNNNDYSNLQLPSVDFSFPSLREFIVKSSGFGAHIMTLVTHAIFCIATMPALEHFLLEEGSIGKETLEVLKKGFPSQFKPIQTERLAWIENVHGHK